MNRTALIHTIRICGTKCNGKETGRRWSRKNRTHSIHYIMIVASWFRCNSFSGKRYLWYGMALAYKTATACTPFTVGAEGTAGRDANEVNAYCLRVKQNIKNHNWIWCIRSCQRPLISIDRRAAARTILRTYERSHTLWDTNNRAAVSWLQTSKYGQNVLLKMTGRSFHRASFSLLASPLRASPFQLAFERVMWRFSSRWLGNLIVAMDIILK